MDKPNWIRHLAVVAATFTAVTAIAAPVGVTVNGIPLDSDGSDGEGWMYASFTLTLTNTGSFTLSGTNTAGAVRVVVSDGIANTVALSNLTLRATGCVQCLPEGLGTINRKENANRLKI